MIPAVLAHAGWRHAWRHPWQVLLATLGIALGVAVVTAIDLTRTSAERSFDHATERIAGRATHHILGGPLGVDESLYAALRRSESAMAMANSRPEDSRADDLTTHTRFGLPDQRRVAAVELAPLVEGRLVLPDYEAAMLSLLGIDPIAEVPFRGGWVIKGAAMGATAAASVATLMTRPATLLLPQEMAQRLAITVGDKVRVAAGGVVSEVEILGLLASDDRFPALAGSDLAVADISTAQELLGMQGRLSRIDVVADTEQADALRSLLPSGAELVGAAVRTQSLAGMTAAFHTNLQALSLIALLVGMFLIFNSQTFMVVQRRRTFGTLRALGVTRGELTRLVLGETAVLGIVGTLVGILLGWLLARELVGLVTRTINDLYFSLAVGAVVLDPWHILKAVVLGLGGSLVAALVPAREAGRVEPRMALSASDLERRTRGGVRHALFVGLGLVALGLLVSTIPSRSLLLGFVGLFLVVLGLTLTTPALARRVALALGAVPFVRRSVAARLAFQGVAATLSRTGVAAAALMLAVATTVGMGVMVASFRVSVDDWLRGFLRADYYVSLGVSGSTQGVTAMDIDLVDAIAAQPGVNRVSAVRHVTLTAEQGVDRLAVFMLNPEARDGFQFIERDADADIWSEFEQEDVVLATESYAYRRERGIGDAVVLRTPWGERSFRIIGIYRDYGSDQGTLAMSRSLYDKYWPGDRAVNGIGIYAGSGFDVAAMRRVVSAAAGPDRQLVLVANREIREASLAVFDRTFTITEVLRLLAGIIAFIGVLGALLAIQLERTRELGVLKALGVTPRQLGGIVLGETALVGAVAGLYAIPVGTVLALLLIEVINRRSFGWGMGLSLDVGVLSSGFLLALAAAILAAIYPAWRMAHLQPAEALRTE